MPLCAGVDLISISFALFDFFYHFIFILIHSTVQNDTLYQCKSSFNPINSGHVDSSMLSTQKQQKYKVHQRHPTRYYVLVLLLLSTPFLTFTDKLTYVCVEQIFQWINSLIPSKKKHVFVDINKNTYHEQTINQKLNNIKGI